MIEDLVHATLEVVIGRIGSVDSNPHQFALEILRNKIGDHLRTRGRRIERQLSPTDADDFNSQGNGPDLVLIDPDATAFDSQVEFSDWLERIRRAIRQLSPICQTLFLGLLENHTINDLWEIVSAKDLRLTRNAFDKRLFDCRRHLRACLREDI